MELEDFKNEGVVGALIAVTLMLALIAFFTYRAYEPAYLSGTVRGVILSYHAGSTGNLGAEPFFKIRLDSGLVVIVADSRKLPYTYKGPVVLNKLKRQSTVGFVYKINASETLKLDNHAIKQTSVPALDFVLDATLAQNNHLHCGYL